MVKLPIFIVEDFDIIAYAAEQSLEGHLEPFYLQAADYKAYDVEGRLLTLGTTYRTRRILFGLLKRDIEHVIVQSAEAEPSHQGELRDALIMNLSYRFKEKEAAYKTMSLKQLVQHVIDINGLEK